MAAGQFADRLDAAPRAWCDDIANQPGRRPPHDQDQREPLLSLQKRPNPEAAKGYPPSDWEALTDADGEVLGIICERCVTPAEQAAMDDDMMALHRMSLTTHGDDCVHPEAYAGPEACERNHGTWNQPDYRYVTVARSELPEGAPWCRVVEWAWEVAQTAETIEIINYFGPSSDIAQWGQTENEQQLPFLHDYQPTSATDPCPQGWLLFVPYSPPDPTDSFRYVPNPAKSHGDALISARVYLYTYYRDHPEARGR